MPAAVKLREDYSAAELRRLAAVEGRQPEPAIAVAGGGSGRDGARRSRPDRRHGSADAARLGASLQRGRPGRADGQSRRGDIAGGCRRDNRRSLAAIVETGPDRRCRRRGALAPHRPQAGHRGAVRRRYHERTIGKLLKELGFSHISARPRHPKPGWRDHRRRLKKLPAHAAAHLADVPKAQADRDLVPRRGADRPEERPRPPVGAARHAAAPARRPALRERLSVRRHLPRARRRRRAGACPSPTPRPCSGISTRSAVTSPGRPRRPAAGPRRLAHHRQSRLPKNITPILLPSRSPELNPVENIWQYLRANWLSNRVFDTYDEIIDAACDAWENSSPNPTITSIGMREWAHVGQTP